MTGDSTKHKPIELITRFSFSSNGHHTIYGVDANGEERIYVEHTSEEEHQAWRDTDLLWHEAQGRMIGAMLENPRTRDIVLKINIKGALDEGNLATAAKLFQYLSPEEQCRILDDDSDRTDT